MKHTTRIPAAIVAGLTTLAVVTTAAPASGMTRQTTQQETVTSVSPFNFEGSAFATRLRAADSAVRSGRTAWAYLGCTKRTGQANRNALVAGALSDFVTVGTSTSKTETARTQNGPATISRNDVSSVTISSPTGVADISGIHTTSRASHGSNGFQADGSADIGSITLNPAGPVPVPVDIPVPTKPGQVVTIPGVAVLTFLISNKLVGAHRAQMGTVGLRIEVLADGSTLTVGRSFARIADKTPAGVLGGFGLGARGLLLDTAVTTDKLGNQPLRCEGTDGRWIENAVAGVSVPMGLTLSGVQGSVRGVQRADKTGVAQTRGAVSRLNLGGGQLVLRGIAGRATVEKLANGRLVKTTSSTVGSLTVNGDTRRLPDPGDTITIPGLARIKGATKARGRYGIGITALTITLLEATPGTSTITLGTAFARIERS